MGAKVAQQLVVEVHEDVQIQSGEGTGPAPTGSADPGESAVELVLDRLGSGKA